MVSWTTDSDLTTYERVRLKSARAFQLALTQADRDGVIEMIICIPVRNCFTNQYLGRENIDYYPRDFLMPGEETFGPHTALNYASMYYEEALEYTEEAMKNVRRDCFKSAELLYMFAATSDKFQDRAVAWRKLGELYLHDRTNGELWPQCKTEVQASFPEVMKIDDLQKRAHYCFERSAEAGDVQGRYLLADELLSGQACTIDESRAFQILSNLWAEAESQPMDIAGEIAIRLSKAYEFGYGCEQSFENAAEFCKKAIIAFEIASNDSEDSWIKLRKAQKVLARIDQELKLAA